MSISVILALGVGLVACGLVAVAIVAMVYVVATQRRA